MKVEDVKLLDPLQIYSYWITERESIRIKKEAGAAKPWTDDVILQKYRFCNVRRMDDKVSRWLLDNWYIPNKDHKNIILAATLARQLNNPESLTAIGFPTVWNPEKAAKILAARANNGAKNFSGAYMITGTLGGTKVEQIIHKVATPIYKTRPAIDTTSIEKSVKLLLPYAGFSTFIAGQVVADLRWAMAGLWGDRNTWAAIGPGSRRGMNRLHGRPIDQPLKQEEFTRKLVALMSFMKKSLPPAISKRLEAIDYQNCLCEFDKYVRTMLGEGKPKQKYPGDA
jgi:hypothetical protein